MHFNIIKVNALTSDELKTAARTGGISVIGPSMSVIVLTLSLVAVLGPAITYMRTGVGSAVSGSNAVLIASNIMGVTPGGEGFTEAVAAAVLFTMVISSAPYLISCLIGLAPIDKQAAKSVGKSNSFIPVMGTAASAAVIIYNGAGQARAGIPNAFAVFTGLFMYLAMEKIVKSTGKTRLNDWKLSAALVASMIVGGIVDALMK